MVSASVKSDFKTLFLILNTICVLFGFYAVATGIEIAVLMRQWTNSVDNEMSLVTTAYVMIGLIINGVASLGYYGAIKENKLMLIIYVAVMMLAAVLDVIVLGVHLVGHDELIRYFLYPPGVFIHAGTSAFAAALAAALARDARQCPGSQGQGVLGPL